jgi:hypothetical protein
MNSTIVSAFLNINSSRTDRNLDNYIDYGLKLIQIRRPKIIFIDKEIYENNKKLSVFKTDQLTHFIPIEITDLYFYKYKNEITEFKLRKQNPDKDTIEYMMVQCNKTEWMREAIEKNIFNTDQFIWIDFGIYHMFQNDELLEKCVLSATEKSYQSIRMPNIWYIGADHYTWDKINPIDFYLDITWYFAGSVFGGDKLSILKFADLMRGKVVSTIYEKKHIMWEINLWYMIYLELIDKKLFNIYFGSHNSGILENY